MKKFSRKLRLHPLPVSFEKPALIYLFLLACALLYAQVLKMPSSNMVFVFMATLPIVSIVYLTVARFSIVARLRVTDTAVRKNRPVRIYINIKNRSVLPFPLVYGEIKLPDAKTKGCEAHRVILNLLPLSDCRIEKNVLFPLRGEYCVGVEDLYVYDLFRVVKLRIPVKSSKRLSVYPREAKLPTESGFSGIGAESPNIALRGRKSTGEQADIRQYETGDSPKNIHWKLSTKSDEILVKDFADENHPAVNIICDLEAHILNNSKGEYSDADELLDNILGDLAVEGALAVCRRELSLGRDAILSWLEDGHPMSARICSENEMGELLRGFCMAEISAAENHSAKLLGEIGLSAERTVFVCSYLDERAAKGYRSLAKIGDELIFCREGGTKIPYPDKLCDEIKSVKTAGIILTELTIM